VLPYFFSFNTHEATAIVGLFYWCIVPLLPGMLQLARAAHPASQGVNIRRKLLPETLDSTAYFQYTCSNKTALWKRLRHAEA
jgi:hypothetical protein